ncbi:hypothetical protein B0H15DRAFT_862218 [Mycena belliarum]|uniref:Uncharacterized protein n=1 Tax=Mycena belliarum TaxID=1033014 RepID=A0AAD6XNR7_9AGAR|nr:hypothetical protein B0H15DRAFT_862218 [Mycena belliae]
MASVVQFTVDDSSPTVKYFPLGDTFSSPNLSAGWNPHWDVPGFSSATTGSPGSGTSLHITSLNGASLQIQWKGIGITLLGNVTRASYSITLDGKDADAGASADPSNNVLVTLNNLADTNHTLSLTAKTTAADSLVSFDRALISALPSPSNLSTRNFAERVVDDKDFAFSGQWSFQNDSGAFHKSTTLGDSASLQFTGTSFLLKGFTSPDAGSYSVILDNITSSFSGKSSFFETDSLLFYASGLDAETVHDLEIVNQGAALVLPVGSASAFVLENSSTSSSSASTGPSSPPAISAAARQGLSSGTVAALVLAGVLIFLIVSGMLLYFMLYRPYRRRQLMLRRPSKDEDQDAASVLVIDIAPEPDTKNRLYDNGAVAGPSRDRTSKRSGFSKWKEEVEGGLGSLGGALGIAFRHSDSSGRRNASGSSHEYDMDVASDSYKSSSSSNAYGADNGKGKGKGRVSGRWPRRREKSLSPRFKLDLPVEPRPRSGSQLKAQSGGGGDVSAISSLSYLSSPSLRPTVPTIPAPPSPSTRSTPYPNTHSRTGSAGALLMHSDIPQPPEPDDGYHPSSFPAPDPLPPVPVPTPPPEPPRQDDRGSVREYDAEDARSVLGDGTARIALRSLSPRTSEAMNYSNEAEYREAKKKRRTKGKEKRAGSSPLSNPTDGEPPSGDTPGVTQNSLFLRNTSPFQVDFNDSHPNARLSAQSRVRFEGSEDGKGANKQDVVSTGTEENRGQPSKASFRLTPTGDLCDTSFLDFTSSSDASVRTRSNNQSLSSRSIASQGLAGHSRWSTGENSSTMASIVPPPHPASRWSTTTGLSSEIHHASGESSVANFPFPVSLPHSPHHPEGTFMPQQTSFGPTLAPGPPSTIGSLNSHPSDLMSNPTSPTDSVPMSVSDIHFRHSDSEDHGGSRGRNSGGLPTHPPLPGPGLPREESYIVQRVVGTHTPPPSLPFTTLTTPTPTARQFNFNVTPSTASRPSPSSSGRGL